MSWLQRLDPRQKRIVMALGAAGVLALIVVISRSRGASSEQATNGQPSDVAGYDFSGYNPSTGGGVGADTQADTSAAVNQSLSDVNTSLATLGDNQQSLMDAIGAVAAAKDDGIDLDAINKTIADSFAAAAAVSAPTVIDNASAPTVRKAAPKDSRAVQAARGIGARVGARATTRLRPNAKPTTQTKTTVTRQPAARHTPSRAPSKAKTPPRKPAKKRKGR